MESPQFLYNNGQMDAALDFMNDQEDKIAFLNDEIRTMRETIEHLNERVRIAELSLRYAEENATAWS